MSQMTKHERLKEIEKEAVSTLNESILLYGNNKFADDFVWLLTELKKSWEREQVLRTVVEMAAKDLGGFDPPHDYWRDHLCYRVSTKASEALSQFKDDEK